MQRSLLLSALAVVMLLSVAVFAIGAEAEYQGEMDYLGNLEAQGDVTVSATVQPKLTLWVTTPDDAATVDFGDVYPGEPANKDVELRVNSNKGFAVVVTEDLVDLTNNDITLDRSLDDSTGNPKGAGWTATDTYTLTAGWDADPEQTYTGTVTYTVTQE